MPNSVDVGGELTQEWADSQTTYLSSWAAGHLGLRRYLDELWPWRYVPFQGKGSSSGHHVMSHDIPVHAVFVTINDLEGCAQGIYHEFAHLRLRTLGVHMETHTGLLLSNEPTELYRSPVRRDIKRPMSAVLQGLYAWLMFVENDWQLYSAGVSAGPDFVAYTFHNLPKIDNGLREVKAFARTTPAGTDFLAGMYEWADNLLYRCHTDAKFILGPVKYEERLARVTKDA